LLTASLREGLRVFSADKAFTQQGRVFPSGTLIFKTRDNSPNLGEVLSRLAASSGAEVIGTNTGWVEEGINFGSGNVVHVRRPAVAIAWDLPAAAGSAGATRFVLERQFGYPVTPIRTRQLASADISRFDVLILPDAGFGGGGYTGAFGTEGASRLKDWVSNGGTIVALGSGAVSFLADSRTGLLAVTQENAARDSKTRAEAQPKDDESSPRGQNQPRPSDGRAPGRLITTEDEFRKAIQADSELPDQVPGVLAKAQLDRDHWITAGLTRSVNVLVSGSAIFSPIKLDRGVNAVYYAGPDQLLASGYLWDENRKQLAFKPFVVVQPQGRGIVVGFTSDPNFRAYMDGLNVLFLNAVFRGAAHARPAAAEGR
jgi:hypothetical protein